MAGRTVVPKYVHILIFRTCDYITWHGNRELSADRIEVANCLGFK